MQFVCFFVHLFPQLHDNANIDIFTSKWKIHKWTVASSLHGARSRQSHNYAGWINESNRKAFECEVIIPEIPEQRHAPRCLFPVLNAAKEWRGRSDKLNVFQRAHGSSYNTKTVQMENEQHCTLFMFLVRVICLLNVAFFMLLKFF